MKHPKYFIISSPNSVYFEFPGNAEEILRDSGGQGLHAWAKEGKRWTDFGDFLSPVVCISEKIRAILVTLPDHPQTHRLSISRVESKRLAKQQPPVYHWFQAPPRIDTRALSDRGSTFATDSEVPKELFYRNKQGQGFVFCDIRLVKLARRHGWDDLFFRPIDVPRPSLEFQWTADYVGGSWPPSWWPPNFTPTSGNVVEVDDDENGLNDAALKHPLPSSEHLNQRHPPPARRPTPETCLISLTDVQALKFRVEDQGYDTELTAEVPLSRPLYDSDTLDISVVIEDEDNVPKLSQITEAVQSILKLFERVLPEIEKRVRAQFELGDPAQTEALLAGLHSPSLFFAAHELASPIRWSFVVEGDPMAVHVEFERLDIVEVWAGD